MNQGIKTIIYPAKDIARAKALFSRLLGVEPFIDSPYYVGFKVGDQDIGLDPNGHKSGPVGTTTSAALRRVCSLFWLLVPRPNRNAET